VHEWQSEKLSAVPKWATTGISQSRQFRTVSKQAECRHADFLSLTGFKD
jgi:hypothetical protein